MNVGFQQPLDLEGLAFYERRSLDASVNNLCDTYLVGSIHSDFIYLAVL